MIALDSSVIIAALLAWHTEHDIAASAVERALASKHGVCLPMHALFETFAVMTRLPVPHRLSPADALLLLRGNFSSVRIAQLPADAVWRLLGSLAASDLSGGVTYDAIILETAQRAGAAMLLTLNERHYTRLQPRIAIERPH